MGPCLMTLFIILFWNKMSIERAASASKRVSLKFSFSDYQFAHFVRERMLQVLSEYDQDGSQSFDQQQIKTALVQILHENPNELYYVMQNVFRYDKDNDQRVSFKEFIDFSVEQHFGEMAIQRLHRQKVYSNGSKRIMNLPEFIQTMEYSLNSISIQGPQQIYSQLFSQVDLDRDGFISYEDYFIFLKEYFGSLHKEEAVAPPAPAPAPFNVDNGAAQRFAKLIYNQLKVILMQIDYNKKMKVEVTQVQRFVSQVLQANQHQVQQITEIAFRGKQSMDYESFLAFIVPFYFCEYYVNVTGLATQQHISLDLFVRLVNDASSAIVSVAPSEKTSRSIFYLATGGGDGALNIEEYVMLMGNIFQNFSFDRRGLARGHH